MQDMVSAALQYLNSGNSPLPGPPPAQAPSQAENLPSPPAYLHAAGNISGTTSLLQAEALPERTRGVTLPLCGDFSQVQQLTGALTSPVSICQLAHIISPGWRLAAPAFGRLVHVQNAK